MELRHYEPADCTAMAQLFHDTVHTVNARDYAPEQLDAWATGKVDLAEWDRSFRAHRTLVAVEGERWALTIANTANRPMSPGAEALVDCARDYYGRVLGEGSDGS